MKNILVLTGSPRKGGNSDLLAEAFIKGALANGHIVNKFETAFKQIQGCRACKACWSTETACIYKDDFTELEPMLEKANLIVFATPLYWFGMSSQLKAAIDRFYAYMRDNCRRPLQATESVLLVCGSDKKIEIFDGIIGTYKGMTNYLKWTDRGIIAVPDISNVGDIKKTDALKQAEKLGKTI